MAQTKVDLLEEDRPIPGQKFVCVSFISPENEIISKTEFLFEKYVAQWELATSLQKYAQFTAFIAYKYKLNGASLTEDLEQFCKEECDKLRSFSVRDDYKSFLDKNEDALTVEYNAAHEFQTSTRGLKIRGVYSSQQEAESRAKLLREMDPNFDVYVGPVGLWMPWEPDAYKTGRVEYLEEELNNLMAKKKANEAQAKEYFTNRVKESKIKAVNDNIEKARASGNKLTQTITPSGELVNIQTMTPTKAIADETRALLKETMFDSPNISTKAI